MIPPILCYHKIDTWFELGFTQLEPLVFRRQIEALARAGRRTLGSKELLATLELGADPSALVLTFDDGYAALGEHAFPIVVDHGFRALVFVITDYVGRENTWDVQYGWRSFRHLTWDELGKWSERGVEVHSHTATHRRLTWISDDEVADELARSREELVRRLGAAPPAVSYPFGAADRRVSTLARQAGYELGFAGPSVMIEAGGAADPLLLPRLPVYGWDRAAPPMMLAESVRGGVARAVARLANRFAVGTSVIKRLGRR